MMRRLALRVVQAAIGGWALSWSAYANILADWGTLPEGSETSFTFTPDSSASNFSDQYRFTLSGTTDVRYVTSDYLATCTRGCGNPVVEFGIYNESGAQVDSSGTATLAAGDYVFQIKGSGMGSGNTAGSGGVITFYSAPPELRPVLSLDTDIPREFGDWRLEQGLVPVTADALADPAKTWYAQTLERTYMDAQGRRVMLSIAYGANQLHDGLQAHRPEYCYQAQGFVLQPLTDSELQLGVQRLALRHLLASRPSRSEPITYWMVLGGKVVRPGITRKWSQLQHGLAGVLPDGFVIRVSSIGRDTEPAFELHAHFIHQLFSVLNPQTRSRLGGEGFADGVSEQPR